MMTEPTILETNADGELRIPAEVLGAAPRARYRLEHDGPTLRLIPESAGAAWESLSADERARSFRNWVSRLPKRNGPPIPAEALRREDLYD